MKLTIDIDMKMVQETKPVIMRRALRMILHKSLKVGFYCASQVDIKNKRGEIIGYYHEGRVVEE